MRRRNFLQSALALGTLGCLDDFAHAFGPLASTDLEPAGLRPPSTPLITCDPYFSVWSATDQLADSWPCHWTGAANAIALMARIDGRTYRLCGMAPQDAPAMPQISRQLNSTWTTYVFEADGIQIDVVFFTPVIITELDLVGRPASYIQWTVKSTDGQSHNVSLYYDNSAEFVVNTADQEVTWDAPSISGLTMRSMASTEQKILNRSGDNLRIDWGTFYVATPSDSGAQMKVLADKAARGTFAETGAIGVVEDGKKPRAANADWPVIACVWNLGKVTEAVSRRLTLAYDDEYSIRYLGENLRPWWRRNGMTGTELVKTATDDFAALWTKAAEFDTRFRKETEAAGGAKYREMCTIAYRQAIAGHKLCAGPKGKPMFFSKECFSNGCIGTVDILYPASPIFAHFNNDLLKATVTPVFEYVNSGRWKFSFAPHDIGQYPLADGQVYGGGEKTEENQMPVEESGNMLIVAGMIARNDGNVDYLRPYMGAIDTWAAYLKEKGLDPENQLCTDDFAGHLAHNANLSIKAIVALGVYAEICKMSGRKELAEEYATLAKDWAKQWKELAKDGDHYKLAFDKPGTWAQKYNLVWDKIFELNIFDADITTTELEYYKTQLRPYGLPLDNRSLYTKTDWEVWTATLANNADDFNTLMEPVYKFVNDTPDRVPFSDWYWTDSSKMRGFQHRPVIGGVFIKLMEIKPICEQ